MKPILFNTESVRTILGSQKTVTRRVVKPQPKDGFIPVWRGNWDGTVGSRPAWAVMPPYQPGDILYVREAFGRHPSGKYCYRADYIGAFGWGWHPSIHMPKEAARIFLRVTDVRVERLQDITEEQAIAEGAVGVPCSHPNSSIDGGTVCCVDCMNTGWIEPPIVNFAEIWDSTIKPADRDKYGWAANPWVWVIEFERISETGEINGR